MARERYAVIDNGRVTNIVVWDRNLHPSWKYDGPGRLVLALDDTTAIGCTWDGGKFGLYVGLAVPLEILQRDSKVRIDQVFRYVTGGVMVDSTKREELRTLALEGINAVTAATDAEAIATAEAKAIIAMQAATPDVLVGG
jgi:hypothetical protein